jgi:crotonobetainyl-CoA:carnitine CoA-transferase CaiB-like acyl-CoA transferase
MVQESQRMAGLLEGLRVLDLSLWLPGHVTTQYLADLGADVLKIEPPGGDRSRPLADRFANSNSLKRSLVLDLKSQEGRARLLKLTTQAEVVVEGFKPGVAERLGADYGTLSAANPAIVYCSISGFGQSGPLASSSGHDPNYQAYAGAFVTPEDGGAPFWSGLIVADLGSGLVAAFSVLAAVLRARQTGEGEHIDVSMADFVFSWVAASGEIGETAGNAPTLRERGDPGMEVYATVDGHVVLGVFSETHYWDILCRKLGLEDYLGYGIAARTANAGELTKALAAAFAARTTADLLAELDPLGVPISPVLSRAEALRHPHFWARGAIARGPDGERRLGHPVRYRNHPAFPPGRPPALGEGGDRGFDDWE